MTPETRRNILRYGIAIDLVIVATGAAMLLPSAPYVLPALFGAVVLLSTWKGGWQGGLTALVLSAAVMALVFSMSALPLGIFAGACAVGIAIWSAAARPPLPKTEAVPVPEPLPQPSLRSNDEYEVECFTCNVGFNAVESDWCSCLTKERTLVCTNCLTCFCKAPPAYKEKFWVGSPPRLFERKAVEGILAANRPPADVPRPLVLSVEGDEEIQVIVQRVCTNLGYGFIHATSGQEGLQLAREYLPNLILADAFAPQLGGREMCRMLRNDPALADTRMVVMTGLYTDIRYRSEALERFRVDDYVAKPVSITELINLLQKHLESVTGLPVQEDLHALHRQGLDDVPGAGAYEVRCANCEKTFDATRAEWCRGAGHDDTLACPHCGGCFCQAPAAYKERFWNDAPPALFERRLIGSTRGVDLKANPPAGKGKRPLILLAHADENVQLIVRTVATTMGFGFIVAANGEEGLALARQYAPELVLSDAFMPKLDGRELCRRLKADPKTARAKVVLMTGLYADAKYRNETQQSFKVDDYVARPLAVGDLIQVFKKQLPREVATAH